MFYKFHNIRIKKKGAGNETFIYKSFANFRGGGVKSDPPKQGTEHGNPKHKPKNLIHDHTEKIRTFAFCIIFALLWGTSPVGAAVNDNLQTVAQALLGPVDAQVTGSYESSSTNAKLNSLQKQVTTLQNSVNELRTALGK